MKALRITAVFAVILGLAAPAWADNITLSPGASITNPVAHGGQGGKGGDGGTGVGIGVGIGKGGDGGNAYAEGGDAAAIAASQAKAKADADAKAKSKSKSEANAPTSILIEGDKVDVPASAPSVFTGSLVASPETCLGSFQAGGSGGNGLVTFGLSFGKTYVDPDCTRRMYARSLMLLGGQYNVVAIALLAQDANVAAAFKAAGVAVPGASAKVDTTIPDLKLNTPLGEPKDEKKSEESNVGTRASLTIPEALVANLAAQSSGAGM